ncbi:MAG: DsrE family protein [Gammaproteobacteria bacterium]|nr:DsrE family protein [Gammaproteobacteria bacterium]
MFELRKASVTICLLAMVAGLPTAAFAAGDDQEKVVYHVNDSDNAGAALRNIGNHLDATDGKAKIVVVTHAKGIDFLLDGAQDKNGNPYSIPVEKLKERGVDFRVCAITLKTRNIDPKKVIPEARIVPSGVAEIGKLQAREGFVYLKP